MEIVFAILILIISVVVHEVAHGYAANALGDPTARMQGRLSLNPIKHLDLVGSFIVPVLTVMAGGFIFGWAKPVPVNPYNLNHRYGEAIVAGAGPLSNILLAVVFGIIAHISALPAAVISLSVVIVFVNVLLAIFNLVPIPPLDGSKLLFAALPYKYQHIRARMEQYGFLLVLLFIFLLWRFVFPIIVYLTRAIAGVSWPELSNALNTFLAF